MSHLQARMQKRIVTQPKYNIIGRSVPAPILGWNARDALSDMDPRYALAMENYFPDGNSVRLRAGSVDHATGFSGPVEFLHTFAKGTTRELIAFGDGGAYDVTLGGIIGAPLASGFASNRWFGANAGANGGETAVYTNGVDPAQQYDGTTWSASGITGPTNPNGVTVVKKRLWVFEEGTGEAWYGPPEAVTGAFAKFDIGSIVPSGGNLVAIGNITLDGGEGPDDLTVFVMKSGAIVIYQGNDPADAANWSIRGVWQGGNPIGGRCLVPFDNDLIYISDVGFQSLISFTAQGKLSRIPISDPIAPAVSDASQDSETIYGWHGIYHPHRRQLLFNIPRTPDTLSDQFVMNSIHETWARFKGWNGLCSAVLGQDLFMGVDGKVIEVNRGKLDSDNSITGKVQTAWNYFGTRGREKKFTQYRVNLRADSVVNLSIGVGVDFTDPVVAAVDKTDAAQGSEWNVDEWNTAVWSQGLVNIADWRGAAVHGHNASFVIQTITRGVELELLATDVQMEVGAL